MDNEKKALFSLQMFRRYCILQEHGEAENLSGLRLNRVLTVSLMHREVSMACF